MKYFVMFFIIGVGNREWKMRIERKEKRLVMCKNNIYLFEGEGL